MEIFTKMNVLLYVTSIVCTIMFSEIIKKFDKKDKLKGYKVWLPFIFSCLFSTALFFTLKDWKEHWVYLVFIVSSVFGFSVFGYETLLKSINKIIENISAKLEKTVEKTE